MNTSAAPKAPNMKTLAALKAPNIKTSAAPKARNMKTSAAPKARNIKTSAAPKARNMKARGKREAQRNASPLVNENKLERSTESAKYHGSYFALSELHDHYALYQGRRASRCSALSLGFHIPRLWRWHRSLRHLVYRRSHIQHAIFC